MTRKIIDSVSEVFCMEADMLGSKRDRKAAVARRVAALLCMRYGVPAHYLADAIGVSRWSVNRMQSTALYDKSVYFGKKFNEAEKHFKSTL